MIGRQVNFFMLPGDLLDFEAYLKRKEPVCFVNVPLLTVEGSICAEGLSNHTKIGSYIARMSDINHLRVEYIETQGYWLVDDTSPVVEFSRSYWDKEKKLLRRGRLYYEPVYVDNAGMWREKPPEFIAWADRMLRWMRRTYTRDPHSGFYIAPQALRWVTEAGGRLVSQ
jgi:hypothetical protein